MHTSNNHPAANRMLTEMDLNYSPRKGWWKELTHAR